MSDSKRRIIKLYDAVFDVEEFLTAYIDKEFRFEETWWKPIQISEWKVFVILRKRIIFSGKFITEELAQKEIESIYKLIR